MTFIDTANVYGGGDNERLIAQLLADRRDEVTLATKFGIVGNPADRAAGGLDAAATPPTCASASTRAWQRLQTDVVDLYYMHRRDPCVPIEETVGAMAELVAAGKVRHLGLSEVTADELRAAVAVHPIAAVQSEWSIWSRDVERNVVPAAAELGVGSCRTRRWAGGSSRARSARPPTCRRQRLPPHHAPVRGGALDANLAVVDAVESVADERARRPRRSRWRGCATAPTRSGWRRCRFPAPGAPLGSRRTWPRCPSR